MHSYVEKRWGKGVFSNWEIKDDNDEERNGSEFQTSGAGKLKDRAPALFRLACGTARRFWEDERSDLGGEYEDRQQEREGGRAPSKYRKESVAILKTTPSQSATGSQWSFFKRDVTWSWRSLRKVGRAALYFIFCLRVICREPLCPSGKALGW